MSLRALARSLIVILAVAGTPARATDDPAGFIADLGKRAIDVLTSQRSEAERERAFRDLFDEGFDLPAISRFVLGPYWRTTNDEQRQEFTRLFETYVVHAYTVRFNEYSDQKFQVQGSRAEGEASALVTSQILRAGGAPPLKIDWRVAKTDDGYKIADVIVEGVSMAVTERQEFASVIQRGGGQVNALLKLLREKIG
jgi:phospholipid transport system substrate-binding protein